MKAPSPKPTPGLPVRREVCSRPASHWSGRYEVRMIRAVRAAGFPVPEVFGEVTLDGRFGIVLRRLDGPTLWKPSRTGEVTFEQAGAIVAALAMSVHKTPLPPEVISMRDYLAHELRFGDGKIPKHIATDVLALSDRLPPGDGLCHCDLSPGNVIVTAEGPKLIDWSFAMRAPAAVDLASSHVILSELAPEIADDPKRPRATNAAGAIRICAAGRHVARGADGGHGTILAHRPHLRRPRQRGAFLAGTADPARRSEAALGRLNCLGREQAEEACRSETSVAPLGLKSSPVRVATRLLC